MRIVYVNGEWVDEANARISVFDRGFTFADAIYEVTAMVGGKRNGFCHEKFQSFPFSVSLFRAAASAARRSARSRSAWLRR